MEGKYSDEPEGHELAVNVVAWYGGQVFRYSCESEECRILRRKKIRVSRYLKRSNYSPHLVERKLIHYFEVSLPLSHYLLGRTFQHDIHLEQVRDITPLDCVFGVLGRIVRRES